MSAKKNRIGSRKVTAALAAAVALGLAGNAAMAGTITYNFNTDGSFADSNGQNALTVSADTGYSAAVASGDLTLTNDGTPTAAYVGVTLTTPFSVSGDFTASVEVSFPNPGNDLLVFRAIGASGAEDYFGFGGNHTQANGAGINNSESGEADGTFELSRTGDSITASYIVNGSTVNTQTFSGSAFGADTAFILNLQHPGYSTPAAAATGTFDNFTITSDSLAVPEPASLGLLAVGGLALLRRRRRASK